ncbi:unnamed protein product [Aphanomyces euteiches]
MEAARRPDGKLPLPPGFFHCPRLTADTVRLLQKKADQMAVDIVNQSQLHQGPLHWTLDVDDRTLQQYKTHDMMAPPGTHSYAWSSVVLGTLDEVATMFEPPAINDPTRYRAYCHEFHLGALDGVLLYNLEQSPSRYIGVHWVVNELQGVAGQALIKYRDWCLLEVHSSFTLDDGRRGWVRAVQSVEMSCCPDLRASKGFVRALRHLGGHVFVENANRAGYLSVTELHQANYGGDLPSLIVSLEAKRRAKAHKELDVLLHAFRLSRVSFVSEDKLVSRKTRSACNVCHNGFGLLGKKLHCRICAEVVCSSCSKLWQIRQALNQSTKVRICSKCSFGVHHTKASGTIFADLMDDSASYDGDDGASTAAYSETTASSTNLRVNFRRFSAELSSSPVPSGTSSSSRRNPFASSQQGGILRIDDDAFDILTDLETASMYSDSTRESLPTYHRHHQHPAYHPPVILMDENTLSSFMTIPAFDTISATSPRPTEGGVRRNDLIPMMS